MDREKLLRGLGYRLFLIAENIRHLRPIARWCPGLVLIHHIGSPASTSCRLRWWDPMVSQKPGTPSTSRASRLSRHLEEGALVDISNRAAGVLACASEEISILARFASGGLANDGKREFRNVVAGDVLTILLFNM